MEQGKTQLGAVANVDAAFIDSVGKGFRSTLPISQVPFSIMPDGISALLQQARISCSCRIKPVRHTAPGIHIMVGEMPVYAMSGNCPVITAVRLGEQTPEHT